MKLLQNRAVALLIALAVIAASTLITANMRIRRACSAVEETFFTVSSGKAPAYYIDQLIHEAASIAAAGDNYPSLAAETEAVRTARRALAAAEESRDIPAMYDACQALYAAVDDITAAAADTEVTAYDRETFADGTSVVAGAARELAESDYNRSVTEFTEKTFRRFPSSLFARLFAIEAPARFA